MLLAALSKPNRNYRVIFNTFERLPSGGSSLTNHTLHVPARSCTHAQRKVLAKYPSAGSKNRPKVATGILRDIASHSYRSDPGMYNG